MTKKLRKKPNILLTSDRPHMVYGDPESRRFMAASFEPPQRRPQDTNGRNSVPKRDLAR